MPESRKKAAQKVRETPFDNAVPTVPEGRKSQRAGGVAAATPNQPARLPPPRLPGYAEGFMRACRHQAPDSARN